jgi:hypothetical protein
VVIVIQHFSYTLSHSLATPSGMDICIYFNHK